MFSCSNDPEITKKENGFQIKYPPIKVQNVEHKKWFVGEKFRDVVSKGIRIHYKLPQFNHSELKELLSGGYIDSLLLRLKKKTYSESETLDTFYINLGRRSGGNDAEYMVTQLREVNLYLVYSAASVERLTRLICPAMKHRFLIEDIEVDDSRFSQANYLVSEQSSYSDHMSKIRMFAGAKHNISGGKSLIGSYYLEGAFYHSLSRRIVGNFLPVSEIVKISDEEMVNIPFCNDPKNWDKTKDDDVRSFKFGR